MAYVDPSQDPNEQNPNPSQVDQALNPQSSQAGNQQNTPESPPSSGGGGGVVSGGAAGGNASPQPAAAKPSSSGSWTNLQSYLDANQDQGATVGQQIAGTVNDQGNKAQNDVTNLGANFNSAVKDNTVEQNPDAVNSAITAATTATANQGLTPDQLAAFNSQANASYSGPLDATTFNGYEVAQRDVNNAQQLAKQTQSEAGRDVLLNNQYKNASVNGYNQGENNLDQLLLQNSSGGQAALQPLAQQWSGLNGALNNTVSTGDAAAANAVKTNQATAANANSALSSASTNFQTQLNTGLANLKATDTAAYNQIRDAMQNGTMTSDQWAALGVSNVPSHIYSGFDNSGNAIGTVPNSYLTPLNTDTALTLGNYATADQYAQAQALAQLAGQPSSSLLAPGGLSQAGTGETQPAYSFNSDQFTSDNNAQAAEYSKSQSDMLQKLNNGYVTPAGSPFAFNFTSIPNAVDDMNNYIQSYGQLPQGNGYRALADWAKQQLVTINQMQVANGFPGYPIAGQNVAVRK